MLLRRFTALALILACAGCSTSMVSSLDARQPQPANVLLAYATPKSIIQIDIAETLPKAPPAVAAPGGSSPAPPTCEQALARFPVLQTEFLQATEAVRGEREALADYLNVMIIQALKRQDGPAAPDTPRVLKAPLLGAADHEKIAGRLDLAVKERTRAEDLTKEAGRLTRKIQVLCPARDVQVTLVHHLVPDPDHVYFLSARRDLLSDDTFEAHIGDNGFLTSVATSAVDRSGDLAVSAATEIGRFSAAFPDLGDLNSHPMLGEGAGPGQEPPNPLAPTDPIEPADLAQACADIPASGWMATAAALASRPDCVTLRRLKPLVTHWPQPLRAPKDPRPPFPKTTWLTLDQLTNGARVNDVLGIRGACGDMARDGDDKPPDATLTKPKASPTTFAGVVTAMPRPCEVTATYDDAQLAYFTFVAMDDSRPLVLPLDRTRFVKREMSYEFANGAVTHAKDSRPSPAMAVVGLPGQIIGGVFSGVTDTFKGRASAEDQQRQYYDAEAARIQAQAALIKAQQDAAARKP